MSTLLVIPGTGGSELYTGRSFFGLGPTLRVWLNYAGLVAGEWRWLALAPDGRTSTWPGVGQLQPGWLLPSYYGPLLHYLGALGYTIRAPQLFWPGTLESDAQTTAAYIESLAGEAPIHCLAHSRGGLVLRRALQILAAAGQLGLVGRCAGLGVPHSGSWAAASLLSGFEASEQRLGILVSLGPGGSWRYPIYSALQDVVRTWPVSYELLPAPGAPGCPPAQIETVYSASAWQQIGVTVSPAWLAEASAYWAGLAPVPAAAEWVDVVGVGLETADQLQSSLPPQSEADYTVSADGDGTVLARWATQPGRLSIITPTGHSALVSDGRVLSALDSYYRVGLAQSITIQGGILR